MIGKTIDTTGQIATDFFLNAFQKKLKNAGTQSMSMEEHYRTFINEIKELKNKLAQTAK